jgi:hypothetical protein
MRCSACASRNRSGNSACNGKLQQVRKLRVQVRTLFNLSVSNTEKRIEYKNMLNDIDLIIRNSKKTCPTQEDITLLTNYVANEYTNRN